MQNWLDDLSPTTHKKLSVYFYNVFFLVKYIFYNVELYMTMEPNIIIRWVHHHYHGSSYSFPVFLIKKFNFNFNFLFLKLLQRLVLLFFSFVFLVTPLFISIVNFLRMVRQIFLFLDLFSSFRSASLLYMFKSCWCQIKKCG